MPKNSYAKRLDAARAAREYAIRRYTRQQMLDFVTIALGRMGYGEKRLKDFCSQKQIIPLIDYFVKNKNCNWNILSWHKSNPVPACGNKYLTDTEFILFFREKGVKIYGEYETKFTYYVTPLNQKDKKQYGHPTIKPIKILQNLIVNSTTENGVVLDCFMGSGSTGVACVNTNRKFIGIELDEGYFNIAKERIEKAIKEA